MDLHRTLAAMAVELDELRSFDDTAEAVSRYARTLLDADDAGVLLVKSRRELTTQCGTSPVVHQAHQLQADLDEGPCLDAIKGRATYVTADTANDPRWPAWGPAAAEIGIHSAVGVRLANQTHGFGSLNVYANRLGAFTDEHAHLAELLAAHITVALAVAKREEGLTTALETRSVIGQAQGIVMQTFSVDAATAFDFLKRISQHENVRLNALAEAITVQRNANARPEKI